MNSAFRPGVEYLKRTRKQLIAKVPKRLNSSLTKCKAYVFANTNYGRNNNNAQYHIIPYTVGGDMLKLVWITNIQYGKLMKLYGLKDSFSKRI